MRDPQFVVTGESSPLLSEFEERNRPPIRPNRAQRRRAAKARRRKK